MKALWVLLGLIKIIGIILLILLAILVVLLLIILISPIRYEVEGEKKQELLGSFHVRWLCRAISIYGVYAQKTGFHMSARIFGMPIFGEERKRKKRRKKQRQEESAQAKPLQPAYEGVTDFSREKKAEPKDTILFSEKKDEGIAEEVLEKGSYSEAKDIGEIVPKDEEFPNEEFQKEESPKEEVQHEKPSKEEPFKEKGIRRIPMKEIEEKEPESDLGYDFFDEGETSNEAEEDEEKKSILKNPHVQYFYHLPNKKKMMKAVTAFLKRIFRGVLPGQLRLQATVGTGDPASTGYVLAAAGIAKAKFGDNLQIKGEFSRAALEDVSLLIKGKIQIGYLIYAVLRLLLTKEIRQVIWHYWKGEQ
ncbi:MAG: hypothetical protein GX299_06740 [Epulopiscium sp.]|jgi:hypothetical protein|nr:hypothetical protein [Candidatus Epulonipiscium sp.]